MVHFLVIICLLEGSLSASLEYSDTRYDNVELSSILKTQSLYVKLFECITGKGTCTADQGILKEAMPLAMLDDCANCSPKQRTGTQTVLEHMLQNRPLDLLLLDGEFDPDGSYRKAAYKAKQKTYSIHKNGTSTNLNVETFNESKGVIK